MGLSGSKFLNYFFLLIDFFTDCFKMPSVPQGAFAVHKIKEKHQHVAVCKNDNCNDEKPGRFDLKHSEFYLKKFLLVN